MLLFRAGKLSKTSESVSLNVQLISKKHKTHLPIDAKVDLRLGNGIGLNVKLATELGIDLSKGQIVFVQTQNGLQKCLVITLESLIIEMKISHVNPPFGQELKEFVYLAASGLIEINENKDDLLSLGGLFLETNGFELISNGNVNEKENYILVYIASEDFIKLKDPLYF